MPTYRRVSADGLNQWPDRPTADELNALDGQQYRRIEDQQRAKAASMGLQVRKACTRSTSAAKYGTYMLVDMSTNAVVAGMPNGYGLGLDDVIAYLSESADS
jgi:hypothetical protein